MLRCWHDRASRFTVTICDLNDVSHTLNVTAATLYEAVAQAPAPSVSLPNVLMSARVITPNGISALAEILP
jgi:hypothetical protein